jgi:type I restriction enzyme S subunit
MSCESFLPLSEVIEKFIDYRGKTPKKTDKGIPLITAKIIKNGRIQKPSEYISKESYQKWMTRGFPSVGDIVLTTEAPLGEVAQIHDASMALAQRVITLRGKQGILDNTYLRYVLQSSEVQHELKSRATGTTVLGIKSSELRKVEIPLQPIEKQTKIGHILSTIDEKIDINSEMNDLLESIAQSLFKSWFIDFDPVKAKNLAIEYGLNAEQVNRAALAIISGVCTPQDFVDNFEAMNIKLTEVLSKMNSSEVDDLIQISSFFPCDFEECKIGEIPKGWRLKELKEVIKFNPTLTLKKSTFAKYADMKALPTSGHRIENVIEREFKSGSKFQNGDVLMARITPCLENGKTAFVDCLSGEEVAWGSTEFIVMRPKNTLPNNWIYLLSRNEKFVNFAVTNMSGTSGRQRVPASVLESYQFPFPQDYLLITFGKIVQHFFDKIKLNSDENKILADIRDALLPRLLNGEIDLDKVAVVSGNE